MYEIRKKKGRPELVAEPLTRRQREAARALDDTVRRYAAMETQISMLIGRGINLLGQIDGFSKLGYATKAQHAREELGLMPGYCSQRARMEELLRERPHLRHLLLTGQVSFTVMRLLAPRTSAIGEEVWADLVKGKTLDQVKQLLDSFDARVRRQEAEAGCAEGGGGATAAAEGGDAAAATHLDHDEHGPEGADGDLAPDTLKALSELARRCVATPGGVAPSKPDDLDERPRGGRWVEFTASPSLVVKNDVANEIVRRETESELTDTECFELIAADFIAGPGGYALTTANAWDIEETGDDTQSGDRSAGADATGRGETGDDTQPGDRSSCADATGHGEAGDDDESSSGSTCTGATADEGSEPTRHDADDCSDRRRRAVQQREWAAFWKQVRRDLGDFTDHWKALSWDRLEIQNHDELVPTQGMSYDEINQRLIHLVDLAGRCRSHLRRLLTALADGRVYRKLGFASLEHYVEERLTLSHDDAKLLIRLQRGFFGLDHIRQAHDEGTLTQSRALLLIDIATPEFESDWLQHALYTTVCHLKQDVQRADRLKSRDSELFAATGGVPVLWRSVLQAREQDNQEEGITDDNRGENGTAGRPHATTDEDDTHDHTGGMQGENGTADRPNATADEDDAHDHTGEMRGENGTADRPNATADEDTHDHTGGMKGENGTADHPNATVHEDTHDHTGGTQGENGTADRPDATTDTHDCRHGHKAEKRTGKVNPRSKGALPLPTFRDALRLVLGDILLELDQDPFTGVARRLRLWIPEELEVHFRNACRAALILLGGHGGLASIMEMILDHFLEQYGQRALDQMRKHPIVARDEARCAVPTCGRRVNLQVHHIEFRSHGGSEAAVNKITLCAAHHLQGIHGGRIRVYGDAPDNLVWELGLLPDGNIHFQVVGRTIVPTARRAAACRPPQGRQPGRTELDLVSEGFDGGTHADSTHDTARVGVASFPPHSPSSSATASGSGPSPTWPSSGKRSKGASRSSSPTGPGQWATAPPTASPKKS